MPLLAAVQPVIGGSARDDRLLARVGEVLDVVAVLPGVRVGERQRAGLLIRAAAQVNREVGGHAGGHAAHEVAGLAHRPQRLRHGARVRVVAGRRDIEGPAGHPTAAARGPAGPGRAAAPGRTAGRARAAAAGRAGSPARARVAGRAARTDRPPCPRRPPKPCRRRRWPPEANRRCRRCRPSPSRPSPNHRWPITAA